MIIDKNEATRVLRAEAQRANENNIDEAWVRKITELSAQASSSNKTFIAALGTGLLAKAVDLKADPLSLKVKAGHAGAHSARSLAKDVLAPQALRLRIDIGVTGREPLNNQPFFRYDTISRDMDVRPNARRALDSLCGCLEDAAKITSAEEARRALRSFIFVRKRRPVTPRKGPAVEPQSIPQLLELVEKFVRQESEGGRRAQAVVAGVFDLAYGKDRIETSRINDPDRHFPGDVAVLRSDLNGVQRVIEVRDKTVSDDDLRLFARKAAEAGLRQAAVVAISQRGRLMDVASAASWAAEEGVLLRVFLTWADLLEEAAFWTGTGSENGAAMAYSLIQERLRQLEVSNAGLDSWLNWQL